MQIKAPKGTRDLLPPNSGLWQYVEEKARKICAAYCYREIRTPIFEHTELFLRGVGDTTDIVQKEMYTFEDKGGRSITLRPEGTAGAARAFLESGLFNEAQPTKLYYLSAPIFRYENPQSGRLREHHQFGIEMFGAKEASADAEVIQLALSLFSELGIGDLRLNINSIGCPVCRPAYNDTLRDFLREILPELCATCQGRFEKNPLRILDCKEESCRALLKDAPVMLDHLCTECGEHFAALQENLRAVGIEYFINPHIVRGLDYYTKTVFEVLSDAAGAQGTVCGGGRYDGLIHQCGGPSMPGVGFGMGIERLMMVWEHSGTVRELPPYCDVYLCSGSQDGQEAARLAASLRKNGLRAEMDHCGRSFKSQFKYADKIKASYVVIMGSDEINAGKLKIKRMDSGEERFIDFYSAADQITKIVKESGM
jgi:histidyl-tRNA synthetase